MQMIRTSEIHRPAYRWSARLKHTDIEVMKSLAQRNLHSTTDLVGIALDFETPIAQSYLWKIRVVRGSSKVSLFQRKCSVYVGLCSQSSAQSSQFTMLANVSGYFLMGSDGILIKNSRQSTSWKWTGLKYGTGDTICLSYNLNKNILKLSKEDSEETCSLCVDLPIQNDRYIPCIYLKQPQDSVQILSMIATGL